MLWSQIEDVAEFTNLLLIRALFSFWVCFRARIFGKLGVIWVLTVRGWAKAE